MSPAPTQTFINFVLDQSGSMHSVRKATVEGFNAFLADQKAVPAPAWMSLTLFNTGFDRRIVAQPLLSVPALDTPGNSYVPGGGTALLDAVGQTVKGTEAWLVANPWFVGKVLTVVLTDGQENSSRHWHLLQPTPDEDPWDLGGLIRWKQNEGWEFVFLGSGGSDWLERSFGHVVDVGTQVYGYGHDAESTQGTYAGVSRAMTASRVGGAAFAAPGTSQESSS